MSWSALIPDISTIEHVVDEIHRKLNDDKSRSTTSRELRASFLQWANIPMHFINRLIFSMYRRYRAVINANGGHTTWNGELY